MRSVIPSVGEEIGPHHLVVLVIEDVAVPRVARPHRRGIRMGRGWYRETAAPPRFWRLPAGAQRIAMRVTVLGSILMVSFPSALGSISGSGPLPSNGPNVGLPPSAAFAPASAAGVYGSGGP